MYSQLGLFLKYRELDGYKMCSSLTVWVIPVVVFRKQVGQAAVCKRGNSRDVGAVFASRYEDSQAVTECHEHGHETGLLLLYSSNRRELLAWWFYVVDLGLEIRTSF